MPTRGLTLSGRAPKGAGPRALVAQVAVASLLTPRQVAKDSLARVPLRDLALEAQYAEIREALTRYREPQARDAADGELKCKRCGAITPEETARCACGNFLHAHRIFTCPGCAKVVPRDARDCGACGAAFWSPVNPPERALTEDMVSEYLERTEREEFA